MEGVPKEKLCPRISPYHLLEDTRRRKCRAVKIPIKPWHCFAPTSTNHELVAWDGGNVTPHKGTRSLRACRVRAARVPRACRERVLGQSWETFQLYKVSDGAASRGKVQSCPKTTKECGGKGTLPGARPTSTREGIKGGPKPMGGPSTKGNPPKPGG